MKPFDSFPKVLHGRGDALLRFSTDQAWIVDQGVSADGLKHVYAACESSEQDYPPCGLYFEYSIPCEHTDPKAGDWYLIPAPSKRRDLRLGGYEPDVIYQLGWFVSSDEDNDGLFVTCPMHKLEKQLQSSFFLAIASFSSHASMCDCLPICGQPPYRPEEAAQLQIQLAARHAEEPSDSYGDDDDDDDTSLKRKSISPFDEEKHARFQNMLQHVEHARHMAALKPEASRLLTAKMHVLYLTKYSELLETLATQWKSDVRSSANTLYCDTHPVTEILSQDEFHSILIRAMTQGLQDFIAVLSTMHP